MYYKARTAVVITLNHSACKKLHKKKNVTYNILWTIAYEWVIRVLVYV